MHYDMKSPCSNCPFRSDIRPFLTSGRVREIARALIRGEFPCHKTTVSDDDDEGGMSATENSRHCVGALLLLESAGCPSQMLRIVGRLGMYDPRLLDRSVPVYSDWDEMADAQDR